MKNILANLIYYLIVGLIAVALLPITIVLMMCSWVAFGKPFEVFRMIKQGCFT